MESTQAHNAPPDCFQLHELEAMQDFGGQLIEEIFYYTYKKNTDSGTESPEYLFAVLLVSSESGLLISSGKDAAALSILSPEALEAIIEHHQNYAVLRRQSAMQQKTWASIPQKKLEQIQLSRHENGLYRNDALLLDFGHSEVLIGVIMEKPGMYLKFN
jgi:hypothetical protein